MARKVAGLGRGGAGRGQGRKPILNDLRMVWIGCLYERLATAAKRDQRRVLRSEEIDDLHARINEIPLADRAKYLASRDFKQHQESMKAAIAALRPLFRGFKEEGPWRPRLIAHVNGIVLEKYGVFISPRTIARAATAYKKWKARHSKRDN